MKYFSLVITHSASPSVTTNAQNEAYWSNMIYFSLVITHSPAPSWTRNTQNWRITRNDQHLEDYKKLSTSGKFHSGALNVTTNIFSSSLKLLTVHGLWWWLRKLSFNMPHTCHCLFFRVMTQTKCKLIFDISFQHSFYALSHFIAPLFFSLHGSSKNQ